MEGFYDYIIQFAVFPIATLCYAVGYIIKHYIPKLPNKYIPLILACLGLVLNLGLHGFDFTGGFTAVFEMIVTGIGSGLVATGGFEAVRNLINKTNENNKV